MDASTLRKIIKQKENIQVEFKSAQNGFPQSLYETVVSFLNRFGGHLILGVEDDGTIIGLTPKQIETYKKEFTSTLNNGNKIFPTVYCTMEDIKINGKTVLYCYIPEGSMVYRMDGYKIYDRNEDGDFEITNNPTMVSECYLRKKSTYSENKIYPYAQLSDLDEDTFDQIKVMLRMKRKDHPWLDFDFMQVLKSAGFYMKDMETGKSGITLGGILVFGKESTIQSVLPHYKTDCIVKIHNVDRYDDRDDIRCNLIKAYDRMMEIIRKHLNEGFYLDHGIRISPRDIIFREIIVNSLIHREYFSQYPARMLIESDQVLIENGNRPHGFGSLNPIEFLPFPKNPNLAKFFKEIGLAEELGSGLHNCVKFLKVYCDTAPSFIEGDIFKTIIPLKSVSEQNEEKQDMRKIILNNMKLQGAMKRVDIEQLLNIKKTKTVQLLNEMIDDDLIERIKINSETLYQRKDNEK